MQLHPREQFTITRQLHDHTLAGTYYVRAVIRNAKTDAIIGTLNLEDQGNQRFTKQWLVPADPSGQGFWISVISSVYSDSGYTTKSSDYGDEGETYLIQDRYVFNPNYPVGPDIDYKKIKKMIDEAVSKLEDKNEDEKEIEVKTVEVIREVPVVSPVNVDLQPVIDAIKRQVPKEIVKTVEVTKEIDMSPIIKAIKDIKIPEIPQIDFQPVIKLLTDIKILVTPPKVVEKKEDMRTMLLTGQKVTSPYSSRVNRIIKKI